MASSSLRTMQRAQVCLTARLAVLSAASHAVSPAITPTPSRVESTMASISETPRWPRLERRLVDGTDQHVHGGDDRDGDETDHGADRDDQRRLDQGDHPLEPVVDLLGVVL